MSKNFSTDWMLIKNNASIDPNKLHEIVASFDAKTIAEWTYISVDPDTLSLLSEVFELLPDELINVFITHPNLTIRSAAVKWKEEKK